MIRVLVVDDSETARLLLVDILRSDPELVVVGEARDGAEAIAMTAALHPDIISMDIQMPRMDGFEATQRIMAETPTSIIVVSAIESEQIRHALDALRSGALAVLPKPSGPGSPSASEDRRRIVSTFKALARVKLLPRQRPLTSDPGVKPQPRTSASMSVALGIAASTGGPAALREILGALPASFPIPILVVQHIAMGFAEGFARWLQEGTALRLILAEDGKRMLPGHAYLAPDDVHLAVRAPGEIALERGPAIGGLRPSAEILFGSLARAFGAGAAALVLTGMGRDGNEGAAAIHAAGGLVIAQDRATSDVFGMPAAVIDRGAANHVLPLPEIARELVRIIGGDPTPPRATG